MKVKENQLYYNESENSLVIVHSVFDRFDGNGMVRYSKVNTDERKFTKTEGEFLSKFKLIKYNE